MTAITKDFRLNAQKRKSLVAIYEDFLRNENKQSEKLMTKRKKTLTIYTLKHGN